MNFSRATILITGGNSGIGRGLAEALNAQGASIIITGRNPGSLAKTLQVNPTFVGYQLDVSKADDVVRFAAMLVKCHPSVSVVINNAGMMAVERVLEPSFDFSIVEQTIATNLLAPIRLTAALLPHLVRQEEAAIVMVSSALAFVTNANAPSYSASKAAIHSWTVALRHQLRDTQISILELIPPLVATNFSPGQAENPRAMPLDQFITEAMNIMTANETPKEILVKNVVPQRNAERTGNYEMIFEMINPS